MNNLDNNDNDYFVNTDNKSTDTELIPEVNTFDELEIDERLLRGIYSMGLNTHLQFKEKLY